MAYNRNLYSSDTDALDAGIIYDQNELMMQDEVNAAIKNGDLIVGQADNLASKMNQFSTGEFIERTTGGDASLSDGEGHLVLIRGNMVHTGYIAKSVNMTVTPIERDPSAGEFTAQIDNDLFLAEMQDTSGTMVFTYGSSGWDYDPANYGITTDGLALPGDVISVTYQKEVRGTITQSDPQTFVSTGWNLYDHSKGYARALYYNDNPRFGITGTYTSVQYSLTITGAKSSVTPDANGTFGIPTDGNGGYIWVNGGNDTDTAVWMCWSDWTTQANGGVWEAYSESEIDLSTIMATYFVNGLMAVGSYQDEIDLSLGKVTANVGKMTYSEENLDDVIAMGVEYDYDDSYIYYGLTEPIVSQISLDNTYDAYDHGIEYYTVTQVPIYTQTLYGINLKNRLERDVVTISQQTLTASEQAQVAANLNVVKKSGDTMTGNLTIEKNAPYVYVKNTEYAKTDTPSATSPGYFVIADKNNSAVGFVSGDILPSGGTRLRLYARNKNDENHGLELKIANDGTKTIGVSDAAAWRSAIGAVNKAGDTMTGALAVNADYVSNGTYSSNKWAEEFKLNDSQGTNIGMIRSGHYTNGIELVEIFSRRNVNNASVFNAVQLRIAADGTRTVTVTDPEIWRSALGLGTSGALPITIAQGGTGQTGISQNITNGITPATNITITTQNIKTWGKVAQIYLVFKSSNAVSSNAWTSIGTATSYKAGLTCAGTIMTYGITAVCTIDASGLIRIRGTISANTEVNLSFTYLLA